MNNKTLGKLIIRTTFFYDLDPLQKKRIIKILKNNKKTVGFIGDGINDALALREADVGISVKNGTQIAKETADLVLLKNDLEVVKEAVSEGRKAFINILKYTKITLSSQLGDILSLIIVSIFPRITPGIPILPVQMLFKNLIYDFGQIFVSWDNVDSQQVKRPVNWDEKKIIPFALITGFVSPCFDTIFFFLIKGKVGDEKTFQTSWFIFCIIMQTLAFHIMRTEKIPFVQSQASKLLLILSASIIFVSFLLPINRQTRNLLQLSEGLDVRITTYILVLNYGYCFVLQFVKKIYIKNFKVWL
jgi:Mg2+-importing ATPase